MATIANLNINLLANAATFNRVMNGAEKTLAHFQNMAGGLVSKLAAIGAGISVAGLIYFTHQQMEAIDAAAKVSDQLGIETAAFTELAYAARLAGMDTQTFGDSLKKMVTNIADPSTEAASAFAALGLRISDLQRMSPDAQLKAVADAMVKVENQGQRAAIAIDIFGKQGAKLLNTIQGGSGALADMATEAQLFGVSISRVDAAKIEAANDAISRVGIAIEGLAMQSAILLAPAIEAGATALTNFIKESGGIKTIATNGFGFLVNAIGAVGDALNVAASLFHFFRGVGLGAITGITWALAQLADGFDVLEKKITGRSANIAEPLKMMARNLGDETAAAFKQSDQAYQDFEKGTVSNKVTNWFDQLAQSADRSAQAVADAMGKNKAAVSSFSDDAQKRLEETMKALENLRQQDEDFGLSANEKALKNIMGSGAGFMQKNEAQVLFDSIQAKDAQAKAAKALEDFATNLTESTRTPIEIFSDQMAKLDEALAANLITQETWNRGMEEAEDKFDKATRPDMGGATKLAAQESRFLSGFQTAAPTDPQAKMAKDTAEVKKNTQRSADALDALRQNQLVVVPFEIDAA